MPRFAALAALLWTSVLLAACGGGGGAADADPATAVPRDALFYAEAIVRPEGERREDALAALGKVLRTPDPEAKLRELLSSSDEEFDYARDVEPWLGERAGLWVSDRLDENGDPGVAVAVAATDLEEAEGAIEESTRRSGSRFRERSHAGVDYKVDGDGFGYAFAEDFVLFGDEPELKRTIDAVQGSDALAGSDRYREAIDGLAEERLAHFYVDTPRFFQLAIASDPEGAESLGPLRSLIPFDRLPPASGAFLADGSRLALDMGVRLPEGEDVRQRLGALAGAGSTPLLTELPADTWGAEGLPRFGETLRVLFGEFAGAFGGPIAQEQLKRELGLDLERDVFSWVGDVALFVRGETLDTVDGGAVIQVTDEDAAADAFGRIVGALRTRAGLDAQPARIRGAETAFVVRRGDVPRPIVLARGSGKVVVAYGQEAASAALEPDETLGDTEFYGRAEDLLGDGLEPSVLVAVPPIVSLVGSSGSADPEWQEVQRYLDAFDVLAIGAGTDDDHARARVAAGLR